MAAPSASDTIVGADPATWAPAIVTLDDNGNDIQVVVGQTGTIDGLPAADGVNDVELMSSDPSIIEVIQPHRGDWEGAPGFRAVAPGSATITVVDNATDSPVTATDANTVMVFTVTANPA